MDTIANTPFFKIERDMAKREAEMDMMKGRWAAAIKKHADWCVQSSAAYASVINTDMSRFSTKEERSAAREFYDGAEKMVTITKEAIETTRRFINRDLARLDFINAAIAAEKTDAEIQDMMLQAYHEPTEDHTIITLRQLTRAIDPKPFSLSWLVVPNIF